jgi:hypothetical protein
MHGINMINENETRKILKESIKEDKYDIIMWTFNTLYVMNDFERFRQLMLDAWLERDRI